MTLQRQYFSTISNPAHIDDASVFAKLIANETSCKSMRFFGFRSQPVLLHNALSKPGSALLSIDG